MSAKSTPTRYGSVAVMIHWTSAIAVILTWLVGFSVANLAHYPALLVTHIALGTIVFLLTAFRILWWWLADKHPKAPAGEPMWQVRLAQTVHVGLYVLLLLMATSGITAVILSGALPTILAGGPIPDMSELIPRIAHGIMARILLALFVVHLGAALWHQFVKRDHLLARMGVGRIA